MFKLLIRMFRRRRLILSQSKQEALSERQLIDCFAGGPAVVRGVMALIDIGMVEALNHAGDPSYSSDKVQLYLQQFNAYSNLKSDILEYVHAAKNRKDEETD